MIKDESEESNPELLDKTPYSSPLQVPASDSRILRSLITYSDNKFLYSEGEPYLKVLIQPQDLFRFRYEQEPGSHGYLPGRTSNPNVKSYPTVELMNYTGEAVIKCRLYQIDKNEEHPHTLDFKELKDKEKHVSQEKGYKACFDKMNIKCLKKKNVKELLRKTKNLNKNELAKTCNSVNLNKVRLRFSAHEYLSDKEICAVYSDPICNKKNKESCALKICRSSRSKGVAGGGEDVMLFVEEVSKGNIRLNFFELDSEGRKVWETPVILMKNYNVFHSHGIYFKTPAYDDPGITSDVKVYMELQRLSDGRRSTPVEFTYTPDPKHKRHDAHDGNGKRARLAVVAPLTPAKTEQPGPVNHITMEPRNSMSVGARSENVNVYPSAQASHHIETYDCFPEIMYGNCQTDAVANLPTAQSIQQFQEAGPSMPNSAVVASVMNQPTSTAVDFENFLNNPEVDSMLQQAFDNLDDMDFDFSDGRYDGPDSDDKQLAFEILSSNKTINTEVADTRLGSSYLVKKLIKDVCNLKKMKLEQWYDQMTDRLERLFEIEAPNGDAILHILLTSHEGGFKGLVELVSALRLYHLLNKRNNLGHTILYLAVTYDMPHMVDFLVNKGCDPLLGDKNGNNVLHHAVMHETCLKPLLDAIVGKVGRDKKLISYVVGRCNHAGQTPLQVGVKCRCAGSIRALCGALGESPGWLLLEAVRAGQLQLLRTILDATPKWGRHVVNWHDSKPPYYSPLQLACSGKIRENTIQIIKLLLNEGADPCACYKGNARACELVQSRAGPELSAILRPHLDQHHHLHSRDRELHEDRYYSAEEGNSDEDITSKLDLIKLDL